VDFRLAKQPVCTIEYPDLIKMIGDETLTPAGILNAVISLRRRKLPDPSNEPNVGSFFKNPVVSQEHAKTLKDEHNEMPQFSVQDDRIKLSAAWMIDYLGWRGAQEAGVMVSEQHALVLVNKSASFASELIVLADKISESVSRNFHVQLEIEPQMIALDS